MSGISVNTTHFADTDTPRKTSPNGYGGVLARQQWLWATDFSRAIDAQFVISVPNGLGARDVASLWRTDQVRRWLAFTVTHSGIVLESGGTDG